MDFLDLLIIGIIVLFAVMLWLRKIGRDLEKEIASITEEVKEVMNKVLFMKVEQHDGKMFAYNALTNDFICQGKDMDELNVNFGLRYPGRKGVLVEPEKA
jgi:hypothetical protein